MFYKMNENQRAKLNEISEITMTDYEMDKESISCDNLMIALEDLLVEYHNLEEELEYDMKENYQPLPEDDEYDLYGVSRNDF